MSPAGAAGQAPGRPLLAWPPGIPGRLPRIGSPRIVTMELGRCPTCATPYTAGAVAGLGILRARPATEGGPRLEYRCTVCQRVLTLVPHGEGRYAPPGDPPPPPVPAEERLPPWVRTAAGATTSASATAAGPARERPRPAPAPEAGNGSGPSAASSLAQSPLGPLEACELLGVRVTTGREELERAFRSRSLTCHPDKVAHLDPEFQALAERKFKRLVEAYRLLTDMHPS